MVPARRPAREHTWRVFFCPYYGRMTRHYGKPSLTIAQQLQHLTSHGMTIGNVVEAEAWLRHVSYYRLSGYWLYFQQPGPPRFKPGTTFAAVTALYDFDRLLRRLVFRAIEHVEIALRGSWAYAVGQRGGHAYLDAALYRDRKLLHENLAKLTRDVGGSRETFMAHYRDRYDAPLMPPSWFVAEIMSFGQLSRWYGLLKDPKLRAQIAAPFGLHDTLVSPLMQNLSVVRNICAHHNRLWNRRFKQPLAVPKKPAHLAASMDKTATIGPVALYNTLTMLLFLMGKIVPNSTLPADLKAHLLTHPTGDLAATGFPADWQARPLWL